MTYIDTSEVLHYVNMLWAIVLVHGNTLYIMQKQRQLN